MFGRFALFHRLWHTARLAWRLFRDPRTPVAAKLILAGTALYFISPVDFAPDWLPLLGQADDLVVLIAGLNFFIKACPRWLVDQHEGRLNQGDRVSGGGGRVIEGEYRRID